MPGTFILSLDCEGKWGIADHLTPRDHALLTDERLRQAYTDLTRLLDSFGVAATFAFTELFLLSRDELTALPQDDVVSALPYTGAAFADLVHGSREGWAGAHLRDLIDQRHEIACHGVSHMPWTEMSREQVAFELGLVRQTERRTFIFPRNAVAHLDMLAEAGIEGFRLAPVQRSQFASLVSEANVFASAEARPPESFGITAIPAGYFVNWKFGPRRLVPTSVTRRRARTILADAAANDHVAHFWLHPENIASAPATIDNVRAILEEVDVLRRRGALHVATQLDYVRGQPASALPCGGASAPVSRNDICVE